MENKKTICLCCIVRDEEKVIGRLIDSCLSIIDYWVIVDTGSKDNTKEIINEKLKSVPGELHERTWLNFGHNRTELMELAFDKADYFLLMDADMEIIIKPDFDKNKLTEKAYFLHYTGDLKFFQLLLVSGHLKWKYIGVTHEYIYTEGIGNSPQLLSLIVNHHADGGHRPEKVERDIKLLLDDLNKNPDNVRSYFYLAQSYASKGDQQNAIKYYSERAKRGGWPEEVYYSLFQIGLMQYKEKNYVNAIIQFQEAYSYRPTRFEALYSLGLVFREQKKYHLAKLCQEEILKMSYPENDLLFVHTDHKKYMADFELAIIYYYLGDMKKAYKHSSKIKNMEGIDSKIKEQNEINFGFIQKKLDKIDKGFNDYMICSMFTVNTPYEDEVKILQASLDKFSYSYEIVGVNNRGNWIKNTQMKPGVIKQVMEKYKKDILWLDADAVVKKPMTFFDTMKGDISFYTIKEWNEEYVGTLYFRYCPEILQFLDAWHVLNEKINEPDGHNFIRLIRQTTNLKIEPLPADYAKIFDNPLIKSDDPIIVHNQASRRFKDKLSIEKIKKETKIYDLLKASIKNDTSCAIIGNGPFKSDLGKQIDTSYVMRCNNFKLIDSKIGSRVDLNISSLYYEIIPSIKVNWPILGVLPISGTLYQDYTDAKQMHLHWLKNGEELILGGNTVWMYGDNDTLANVFKEVVEEIKAFPTVGIMAIAIARWLGFKTIILSGFTFFKTEKSHYWSDIKVQPSSHHDPEMERLLVLKWIQEDDREYILDDLMKEKLFEHASSIKSDAIK